MSDTDLMRCMAEDDRPREKALKFGIRTLTDAELLAILLRVGVKGCSVLQVARNILQLHDNDLGQLASCTPRKLAQLVPGMGPTKAITVSAAIELGIRAQASIARKQTHECQIRGSEGCYNYIRDKLINLPHEEFWVIMLSHRLVPIACERVSTGGISATMVDARILFKKVIDHQASAIVLVHNHPSGNLTPSPQDDDLTHRLVQGAKTLDVRIIDHLIITAATYYSYADEGRLPG